VLRTTHYNLETSELDYSHLVVDAAVLYFMSTRNVVEVLTES